MEPSLDSLVTNSFIWLDFYTFLVLISISNDLDRELFLLYNYYFIIIVISFLKSYTRAFVCFPSSWWWSLSLTKSCDLPLLLIFFFRFPVSWVAGFYCIKSFIRLTLLVGLLDGRLFCICICWVVRVSAAILSLGICCFVMYKFKCVSS